METKEFGPQEGYDFLNRWTTHTESYGVRFAGKDVIKVSVLLKDGRPASAVVHYQTDNGFGFENINLEGRLRDKPISEHGFVFMQTLTRRGRE